MRQGKVVAVCMNPYPGLPKYRMSRIRVDQNGIEGDYHCREFRPSFSNPGTMKPNTDRHILVVAQETLDSVNVELGLHLKAGDLGENILVEGLGDLSDVEGENMCIGIGLVTVGGNNITLRFTQQNAPCKNTAVIHPHFNKTIYSNERKRRGLLCAVESGVGALIKSGDAVTIYQDFGPKKEKES